MSIVQQMEHLIAQNKIKKAQRLLETYFAVYPQQARKHIASFQEHGHWELPPIPQSLIEIENRVRLLWQENYALKAIEFYRLHTGHTLKESAQKVQRLCSDIPMDDE